MKPLMAHAIAGTTGAHLGNGMARTPTQIRLAARGHTRSAIKTLAGIMTSARAPAMARVSAANAMLDRGWGRPTPPVASDDEQPPARMQIVRIIVDPKACADPTASDARPAKSRRRRA